MERIDHWIVLMFETVPSTTCSATCSATCRTSTPAAGSGTGSSPPAAPVPDDSPGTRGFAFDRFGVRVPTIVISAYTQRGMVIRDLFHADPVLATMRERFGLGPALTRRDAAAPLLGPAPRDYHRTMPDAAPGSLQLIQSLAEPDAGFPRTREETAAWLRTAGLLPAGTALTNSEHAALLRLREAVRDVLAAHTAGREDPAAAARLTRALAEGRLVVTVDPASAVRLASAARASYPSVVAAVAVAIAESAVAGTWPYLKCCPASDCGRPFYDDSGLSACPVHVTG